MENKITQKTESPTLILAHRLKKIKQRLINCKSIEEEDIIEINSIVSMLESQEKYLEECTSSESSHLSKLNELTMQTDWNEIFLEKTIQSYVKRYSTFIVLRIKNSKNN